MSLLRLAAAAGLAVFMASCQAIPKEQTLAQYCARPDRANKDLCKINVEIDGTRRALDQTNITVSQARALAEEAKTAAGAAQATADQANSRAMHCETRTIQRTNIGTCSAGYTLMECTQTRYTYRAGGPSIMRAMDDQQCRFNDKVLEMKVRCCTVASAAPPQEGDVLSPSVPPLPSPAS